MAKNTPTTPPPSAVAPESLAFLGDESTMAKAAGARQRVSTEFYETSGSYILQLLKVSTAENDKCRGPQWIFRCVASSNPKIMQEGVEYSMLTNMKQQYERFLVQAQLEVRDILAATEGDAGVPGVGYMRGRVRYPELVQASLEDALAGQNILLSLDRNCWKRPNYKDPTKQVKERSDKWARVGA